MADYLAKMPSVWVEGQLVGVKRRPGHNTAYLTLRDADVDMSLSASCHVRVLDELGPVNSDGAKVVVRATPEFWPRRGVLQLNVTSIRLVGTGQLLAQIDQLRRILADEGLFDSDRKQQLPFLPRSIGLICGRGSAAERDVVKTVHSRWPSAVFETRTVAVQGTKAVDDVCLALTELDQLEHVDVIVMARGGGSVEDLLPFSHEKLVRAVAACRTPTVSAIGHEVDYPVVDAVADVRASTPTDAGRRVVPDLQAEYAGLESTVGRLHHAMSIRVTREQERVTAVRSRAVMQGPGQIISAERERVGVAQHRSARAIGRYLERARDELTHAVATGRALSPSATLHRGYALVTFSEQNGLVTGVHQADVGTTLDIRLCDGSLTVTVDEKHER